MQITRSRAMYFVASGAVAIHLPDGTAMELGSGEFFGEIALFEGMEFAPRVTSLAYSQLLMLAAKEFRQLLDQDAGLREKIEGVARQRMRALQVWQQFQSGERQHEPLPDLPRAPTGEA